MKFKIISQTNKSLAPTVAAMNGTLEESTAGKVTADINIMDLARLSHTAGFPLKVEFNDRTGYVITILDN